MNKPIILVDTFGYFFRSFHALPPLQNSKQFPTSLLTGFSHFVYNLYKDNKDTCIIFALEGAGNKRKEIYSEYKANRVQAPQELLAQLPIAIEWLTKMKVPTISIDGYEADDCIANLAYIANNNGLDVVIVSHDKDLYQLINDKTSILDYARQKIIRDEECREKFGVSPSEFIMYQSIVGDSSDNIPGIKGIGAKGAQKIISHFKDLESLYAAVKNQESLLVSLFGKRNAGLIKEHETQAFLSRELVSLKKDMLDSYDFSKYINSDNPMPLLHIQDELREYELFKTLNLLKRYAPQNEIKKQNIPSSNSLFGEKELKNTESKFTFKHHSILDSKSLFAILDNIPKDSIIAYDCESDGLDRDNHIVGFSFCIDGVNGYYVPLLHGFSDDDKRRYFRKDSKSDALFIESNSYPIPFDDAKKALEIIFSHVLIGHNIKFDINMALHNFNIMPTNRVLDSMVLAWLIGNHKSISLDNLMLEYFHHSMIAFDEIVPKGATFDSLDINIASKYAAEDAVATYKLYKKLESICDKDLLKIAIDTEYPFISILALMEKSGIEINREHFLQLRLDFTNKLQALQSKIYEVSGYEFNINSPKQVSEILFDKLKLDSKGNKQKSTNEIFLQELIDAHPIIPLLLEYREVFKLFSSYIEPLLKLSVEKHRIYTSFLHTGTSTGRLSSKNPNLQNISVRSELGRSIREGFIAKSGCKLVSLDYSQIELRLLAHFSRDSNLIAAFMDNEDIHSNTAKRIFKDRFINADSKDRQYLRSVAKSINFGLIYGMGAKKLAKTLSISQDEAKGYINSYFDSFPSVRLYLDSKKEEIERLGYSETLIGRRRYFNFINVGEFMRQNFLREGVNTIFQGSAADIIKRSMIRIYDEIDEVKKGVVANMLLQVHDELIFEIEEGRASILAARIKDIMESSFVLRVPLECNVSIGDSWDRLK